MIEFRKMPVRFHSGRNAFGQPWQHISGTYLPGTMNTEVEPEFAALIRQAFHRQYGNAAQEEDFVLVALTGCWFKATEAAVPKVHPARFVQLGEADPSAGNLVHIDLTFAIVPASLVPPPEAV